MQADKATLQTTFNSPNHYVIPVFQRYYTWNKAEWETLWNDILELREPEETSRTHFMGTMVFVPVHPSPAQVPAYQVIDGQQRMVTLSLLLCVLRDVAAARGFDMLAQQITQTFLIHPFNKGREYFRVYPRQRDREQYIATITHDGPATGPIGEAVEYFKNQLEQLADLETEEKLRAFFAVLQARLEFVHITLGDENPYRIFKSLNSTGVDLSESDLIRNFVFMHVPIEEQDDFDDQCWKPLEQRFEVEGKFNSAQLSGFFRDFLMRNGHYVPPAATFQIFEKTYTTQTFAPASLAKELMHHVIFYERIQGVKPYPDARVHAALAKLRTLDSSTTYPLLLNLMLRVEQGQMTEQDLAHAIELLSGFILRRFVCAETSRAYGRWFATASANLGDHPVEGLLAFLRSKGFPYDRQFKAQFVRAQLYGSRYSRPILEALEAQTPHKEKVLLATATIEHIMPQTLTPEWKAALGPDAAIIHADWLDTIGNLTLSAYNGELQNKPFAEKRQAYKESNISLTRQLADYSRWTDTEIQERGFQLAERAAAIWIGPEA